MLNIAVRAARRAGTIINRALNRLGDIRIDPKGHRDYVTEIDREAENAIIQTLMQAYPSHAIVTEESGEQGSSDYVWVIDPLDSRMNFIHGYPQFAVSVALKVRGELDQAVIFDPVRDELFTRFKRRWCRAKQSSIARQRLSGVKSGNVSNRFSDARSPRVEGVHANVECATARGCRHPSGRLG
jgi:fructose-1,6-bisphosphatase/inositol monophosphatase family enzyme